MHFEDKIDLVIAVIVEREPHFAELLELPAKAGSDTVEANLVPWAEELLELLRDNQPIFFALMGDRNVFARFKERLRERQTGPVAVFQAAARYVEAEQGLGASTPRRPGGRCLDPDRRLPRPHLHRRAGRNRQAAPGSSRGAVRTTVRGLAPPPSTVEEEPS